MNVWRIQDTNNKRGKAGAVSPGFVSDYPGEAEMMVLGFSPGKAYDSLGIGRHRNFLVWGWSAAPSKMTDLGRKLFINCICYMKKVNHKKFFKIPILSSPRDKVFLYLEYALEDSRFKNEYLNRFIPKDLMEKYKTDMKALLKLYEDNVELIYGKDNMFYLDEDLITLNIRSNRQVTSLQKMVAWRFEESKAKLAQKVLLRYTNKQFETAKEWETWFKDNRASFIFSDTGDYNFYVLPE